MYSLIVLGIVPGTDLQIGFSAWLVLGAIGVVIYKARHQIGRRLAHQPVHASLHASQLHQRAV